MEEEDTRSAFGLPESKKTTERVFNNMTSEHFQAFAENGHRVFLLESIDGNSCGCGNPKCTAIGKHPVASNWQNTPEWDEDQLSNMADVIDGLERGYGVLCRDLLVVDIDAKNGGVESYAKLLEAIPAVASAGLIVETGSGGGSKHLYFTAPSEVPTVQTHKDYPGIDFKHSGFVVGPGSPHASGRKYKVLSGSVHEIDAAPADLIELLKREPFTRVKYEGGHIDVSDSVIRDMLNHVTCYDDYEDWLKVGMAVHHATGGNGIDLWREWSQKSAKYDEEGIDNRWHRFGKSNNPITVGTLIKLAKENGWVERISDQDVELQGWFAKTITGSPVAQGVTKSSIKDIKNPLKGCPVDVSTIDLTMPPGFCGEVTKWINKQCRYPRLNLSAMASLYAVGNIAGLNYAADDTSRTRANLAIFCVAGSGTGKDAVLEAVNSIIILAGMSACNHGKIKSEREMYQNLIHHQAAIYTIDEVGAHLSKINNASRSGASHLEGVIETFMSVYTKSGSFHIVGGDDKRDLARMLAEKKAQAEMKIENNEDPNGFYKRQAEWAEERLKTADRLVEPFLSLAGFTTPTQLSKIMTIENAESGFLGRTVMCVESDINPYPNPDFTKEEMSFAMKSKILALAGGGRAGDETGRVERTGPLNLVPIDDEARDLIERCIHWAVDYNQSKIEMGLEPFSGLYRRVCEKAIKMALILGIGDGRITVEHVEWAMAASMRDAEEKVSAITIEDKSFSKLDKLVASISKAVKNKPGQTLAYIYSRSHIRNNYAKEDVIKAIDLMSSRGEIRVEDDVDKRNNEPLKRYYPR